MVVVIKDQLDCPLERFVFSFKCVVNVEPDDIDKPLVKPRSHIISMDLYRIYRCGAARLENAFTAETLAQYFRAFLIKLSVMDSQLGEFSDTSAFNVLTWKELINIRAHLLLAR